MEPRFPHQSSQFDDWKVGQDYVILRLIGQGGYGAVVEAIQKSTQRRVAIKRMQGIFSIKNKIYARRILREIVLLRRLRHPYIVELIEIIEPVDRESFDEVYLVLELADMDLQKMIESELKLTMEEVRSLTYKLLCCLNYIHSAKIIHRDLKPDNILLTNTFNQEKKERNPVDEWHIKICDFGLARSMVGVESDQIITDIFGQQFSYHDQEQEVEVGQNQDPDIVMEINEETKEQPPKIEPQPLKMQQIAMFEPSCLDETQQRLDKLETIKPQILKLQKVLSDHVVTRFYRAPEVILMSKDYGSPIDVWSIGCIFAEMLEMVDKNPAQRIPLFPGRHCFPLSPDFNLPKNKGVFTINRFDQINSIIQILGTPTDEDKAFIIDEVSLAYLNAYQKKKQADLSKIYPRATPEAISFLKHTIQFNPYIRDSVKDVLHHEFFKPVHSVPMEVQAAIIDLEFDHTQIELTNRELRALFLKEIDDFRQNGPRQ